VSKDKFLGKVAKTRPADQFSSTSVPVQAETLVFFYIFIHLFAFNTFFYPKIWEEREMCLSLQRPNLKSGCFSRQK